MAREDIPLDLLDQKIRWGERKLERKRKEREEEGGELEKLYFLSRFFDDRTFSVGVRGEVLPRDKSFT